jgi:hypothetical protein
MVGQKSHRADLKRPLHVQNQAIKMLTQRIKDVKFDINPLLAFISYSFKHSFTVSVTSYTNPLPHWAQHNSNSECHTAILNVMKYCCFKDLKAFKLIGLVQQNSILQQRVNAFRHFFYMYLKFIDFHWQLITTVTSIHGNGILSGVLRILLEYQHWRHQRVVTTEGSGFIPVHLM